MEWAEEWGEIPENHTECQERMNMMCQAYESQIGKLQKEIAGYKTAEVSPSNSTELLNIATLESKIIDLPVIDVVEHGESYDIEFGMEKDSSNPWITVDKGVLSKAPAVGDILKILPPQILSDI